LEFYTNWIRDNPPDPKAVKKRDLHAAAITKATVKREALLKPIEDHQPIAEEDKAP